MKNLAGLHILVTGGAGFIGSHLVDALIAENSFVRVLDNLSSGKKENIQHHKGNRRFELIQGSITEASDVKNAMKGIDLVYHLACKGVRHSLRFPLENHRVNAEGTLMVLQQAHQQKVKRFIYCSSSEVYGTAQSSSMSEKHPIHPLTIYGASKYTGELYTKAFGATYGLPEVVIRPFNTYGPRSHHEGDCGEVIPKFIVRALNNVDLLMFGRGKQSRDFTYVEDTAQGLVVAAKNKNIIGKTLNIAAGFEISIRDIAKLILKTIPESSSKIKCVEPRPGDVFRLCSDATIFLKSTQWLPKVEFKEGLRRTIQWFKSQPGGARALLKEEVALNWK